MLRSHIFKSITATNTSNTSFKCFKNRFDQLEYNFGVESKIGTKMGVYFFFASPYAPFAMLCTFYSSYMYITATCEMAAYGGLVFGHVRTNRQTFTMVFGHFWANKQTDRYSDIFEQTNRQTDRSWNSTNFNIDLFRQ